MDYGLIGEKLGHSYSKLIQEKLLDNYVYELHPLNKEDVDAFMKAKAFKAINVTIPYKQTVIPYLDKMDAAAKKIGAVNTIVNKNNTLTGYNTDYYGFAYMLDHHNITIKDKKVLILGNGGAAKAILAVAEDKQAKSILIANRTVKENVLSIEEIYSKHQDVDIVINTTPVGMYPNVESCPIDFSKFISIEAAVDIVYNPYATEFVLQAKQIGIKAISGLEMLVAQAKYALEFFKDITINDDEIDRIYKEILHTTTNIICFDLNEATQVALLSDKEVIDLDTKSQQSNKSIESISQEIGVLINKVIYCPSNFKSETILHNLCRNGFIIEGKDVYSKYCSIIENL